MVSGRAVPTAANKEPVLYFSDYERNALTMYSRSGVAGDIFISLDHIRDSRTLDDNLSALGKRRFPLLFVESRNLTSSPVFRAVRSEVLFGDGRTAQVVGDFRGSESSFFVWEVHTVPTPLRSHATGLEPPPPGVKKP